MSLLRGLALAALCGFGSIAAAKPTPTSYGDIMPIFQKRCVVCHNNGDPMGGLSLVGRDSYQQLVKSPSAESAMLRVAPGQPGKSYLLAKIKGVHVTAGGKGFRMPVGFGHLSPDEISAIESWIAVGAAR